MKNITKIFISHIHEEAVIAKAVKQQLIKNFGSKNIEVFLAEEISLGEDWFKNIKRALTNADIILVLFSPYSLERPWINIEAGYGIMSGKTVIPVCCLGLNVDNLPIVYRIHQSMKIDEESDVVRLLEEIADLTPAKKPIKKDDAIKSWIDGIKEAEAIAQVNEQVETLFKNQLIQMANDPEVQAELRRIDQEFSITEADGLRIE